MTNPKPPREWWIPAEVLDPHYASALPFEPPLIHVIEYSAYEQACKERDEARAEVGRRTAERDLGKDLIEHCKAEIARHKDEAEFWKRSHKTLQEAANTHIEKLRFRSQASDGYWKGLAEMNAEQRHSVQKLLAEYEKALEDMLEHICDGGGERPCSQMWFQDVAEEMLTKLKAARGDKGGET